MTRRRDTAKKTTKPAATKPKAAAKKKTPARKTNGYSAGARLREWREGLGKTQVEVAKVAGISQTRYSAIELSDNLTTDVIRRCVGKFGYSPGLVKS